ncbi:MAG: N-acetylglucosamine-6-phosphate deacetylase [Planctomycetota bacterium]|nr:MAG: N-acetylglucosamine-6-phosphate deacetylase [Planctomycetota bacterium]
MTIHARHYATGLPIRLEIADGVIASVTPSDRYTREADLPYVAPGFFDLQINGYGGVWFCDPDLTVESVLQVLAGYWMHGVTRLFPTLITSSREALCHGLATIRAACEREPWASQMVAGCHVEGPFISAEDGPRGAHPREQVRPCDSAEFEAWQTASGGRVRLITLAAEAVGAESFIAQTSRTGVTIALGHSAANSEQIAAAVRAGARLSTHLGNGAMPMMPRHPNLLWDQLGEDRLAASLITDGHHVPPAFLRTAIRAKGATECIITCDASGLAGCPPGIYPTQGQSLEVLANGKIVVTSQRTLLAGSAQTTETCVARCIAMTGVALGTACDMAGDHPARILRIPRIRLMAGCRADLVLFHHRTGNDPQLEIVQTWLAGSRVAGR